MSHTTPGRRLTRRAFLASAAGGGLLLGFRLPRAAGAGGDSRMNAWLRISPDGSVTVVVPSAEMGQGISTALPMIVADELGADWSRVRFEFAPVADAYRNPGLGAQATGGSTSVREWYAPLRRAGAAAREMLVSAAAATWGVGADECAARQGQVLHAASGRALGFGALAGAAATIPPPARPRLKPREELGLIGTRVRRLDTPPKVEGSAVFGMDVRLPGLLHAAVRACPVLGGSVAGVNTAHAPSLPGVRAIVSIPGGVAVVAESWWQARQGLEAVEIQWNEGRNASLDSGEISRRLREGLRERGAPAAGSGEVSRAFARAARIVEARYEVPFQAHAPMEPMTCTAHVTARGCEIWAPTQSPQLAQSVAMQLTGLDTKQVRVHTTFLGGGFGRRFEPDFVVQAVLASKAVGQPVKVTWSREEDLRHDFYRPASVSHLRAALGARGRLEGWTQRLVMPSIAQRLFPAMVRDGVDRSSVQGAADLPYDLPHRSLHLVTKDTGVPVGFWRSVGHSHNAFYVESFLDEVAHAVRRDPYTLRRELLARRLRHLAVLDLAATKAGWGGRLPRGRALGLALHESFGSIVAQVAEVSVGAGRRLRVHRVVCAIDCGQVINPDTVEAQMESAIAFGLTAALASEITIRGGRVEQGNFDDYPLLGMAEMPAVETHIVDSDAAPGGVGEPGMPPIAPAVANALFALTGRRLRRLPIRPADLPG